MMSHRNQRRAAVGLGLVIGLVAGAFAEERPGTGTTSFSTGASPAASTTPSTSDAVLLRYNFHAGQVVRYLVDDRSTLDLTYGGQSTTIDYSTNSWKHYSVKSVAADGSAVLELVIDRARLHAREGGRTLDFDTNQVGIPPAEFTAVTGTIGKPRDIKVSARGEILSGPAFDETKALAESLDDQNLNVLVVLPEQPVAVGQTWRDNFEVEVMTDQKPLRKRLNLQRIFTLSSIEDRIATIDLHTVVLAAVNDPNIESQLIQRTPSGVIKLDLKTGRVASRETRVNNEVVNFKGPSSRMKVVRAFAETITEDDGRKPIASAADPVR